jgi:hypothetical protein
MSKMGSRHLNGISSVQRKVYSLEELYYFSSTVIPTIKTVITVIMVLYVFNKDSAFKIYFMAASFTVAGRFV